MNTKKIADLEKNLNYKLIKNKKMKTTLGRNEPDGDYATVVEEVDGNIYITCYKQHGGMSNFKKKVIRILLTEGKLSIINERFNAYTKRQIKKGEE
jgi:hypothetical protein